MSPDNLVSFPNNGSARSSGDACAEFCARWRGSDVAEGARLLLTVLPERVPGALRLVIARALGELDVPPFASPDEFRAAVRRFATPAPELVDISDVRRARRNSRYTLERLARETSLPAHLLRQLEWGDFRDWHHEEWTRRVCYAYARAAGLEPDRVHAIVEQERAQQLSAMVVAPAAATTAVVVSSAGAPQGHAGHAGSRRAGAGLAAAAAVVFAAGLLAGGALFDRHTDLGENVAMTQAADEATSNASAPPSSAADAVPSADQVGTAGEREAHAKSGGAVESPQSPPTLEPQPTIGASDGQPEVGDPARVAQPPNLRKASVAGSDPSFSPAFSSTGSAVFYHRDEGAGSALMKADSDGDSGGLRIVSIVQDGARNYHVKPSPDGSQIAFDSDRDGERGVYIANADGSNVRRVSGPGFAAVPSWSPDGNRLAFVRGEPSKGSRVWNLWVLDLAANTSVKLTSYRYGQPWGASWFPDGQRLAFSHEDRLTVLNLQTGKQRVFRSPRAGRLVRTPAVSPDGRHIVFQVYRDGAWLLDLEDGSTQRILADPTAEEFAWDATGRRLAFHSRRSGEWSVWIMSNARSGPTS